MTHLSKWRIRDFVHWPCPNSFAMFEIKNTINNEVVDLIVLDDIGGQS